MQIVVVAAVVAGCALLAWDQAERQERQSARDKVVATARAVADDPGVRQAATGPDPSARLQPYAEQVRHDSGVDFVTIMDPHGVRWTHPDPARIGARFLGHTAPALRDPDFTETYTGTLGPSVRAVTPVRSGPRVLGYVSVGITVRAISGEVREQLEALTGVALAALAVGGTATYVVNRRLRRHTHGMGAAELSRMYDYHEATLHAVREGLVLLDGDRRVALCNDAARELLGLPPDAVGRYVADLRLPPSLTGALLAAEPRVDEVHLTAERVVVVNTRPVRGGDRRGTVVTLRDHTDLQALSGELDIERGFTEALRAQAHEAANRLHTVVSLIELGRVEDAVEFATAELELAQALTDQVVTAVAEPVLAALLLAKATEAAERGVEFRLTPDSRVDDRVLLHSALTPRDLVTILGNLIDNALDAAVEGAGAHRPRVEVTARAEGAALLLRVADSGRGVEPASAEEIFRRGWSTKAAADGTRRGLGLALVEQAARRGGGSVRVDREVGAVFTVTLPMAERVP